MDGVQNIHSTGDEFDPSSVETLIPIKVNAGEDVFDANMRASDEREINEFTAPVPAHSQVAVLVGGGPSLPHYLDRIRILVEEGATVIAMNGTMAWLRDRGIYPDIGVLVDSRPESAAFVEGAPAKEFFLSAQAHPTAFDNLEGEPVTMFWPAYGGVNDYLRGRRIALIGGGTTVGLQAVSLAFNLGFRSFHLFGYDSSYDGDAHHAYSQELNDGEDVALMACRGRQFVCAPWMVRQATEFIGVAEALSKANCEMCVHGDGALPELAKGMEPHDALTAVYDLSVAPPTWNFSEFLLAAERARIDKGLEHLDIVFQPGPKGGFRDDDLPPDIPTREMMLHRVCVSLCNCLPSMRNITILKERAPINADVFPGDWTVNSPTTFYGLDKIVSGLPMALSSRFMPASSDNLITITVREAPYWPERNSNIDKMVEVAELLKVKGYDVVMVPDTFKPRKAAGWDPLAAFDVEYRIGLYQSAVVNVMHANGCCEAARLSGAPHIILEPINNDSLSTSEEFLARFGVKKGDQFPYNGIVDWETGRSAGSIVDLVEEFIAARRPAQ